MAMPNSIVVATDLYGGSGGTQKTSTADSKSHDQVELQEQEYVEHSQDNLTFDEEGIEPALHARTWIALAAMHLLVFTQVLALQGPPAVVCDTSLGLPYLELDRLTCLSCFCVYS